MRPATFTHPGPASGLPAYWIGRLWLRLAGWRVEGEMPNVPKAVVIAAPHTSGWDLPYMLAAAWLFRAKLSWLGKHTLFKGIGALLRWLGGIPVDRRAPRGQVAQVVERFSEADGLFLAIAPAGTRSRSRRWKSGFYHIAAGAQVPIVCGFLDFGRKVAGLGPAIMPSGDLRADMDRIREFYSGIVGHSDELTSEIRLREEDEAQPQTSPPMAAE